MSKDALDLDGTIIIDVSFPPSEFRKLGKWSVEVSDCANIYEMFSEVIRPLLIAMGYATGSIIDGCREYIAEYEGSEDKDNASKD